MEEQLNYQPVSFQGIVPQLDVGDPSQSFVNSMQSLVAGEEANLAQMQRNAAIENKNINVNLKGLEALSQFSEKAFETYTKISNQNLKTRLAEIFVENKNNPNLDYSEFEADEKEALDVETGMSLETTKALQSKSNLTATDSANAAKLRNYTSLESIVAHNGRVAGAMESYGPALEKWVNNPQFRNIKPGAEYNQIVDEFNRIWADKTGLSGANQQFLAKYVYPQIRKKEAEQSELFTKQFNVKHASEQDQIILQKLKSGLITLEEASIMSNGLTKSDGKTLRTPDDFWTLMAKGEFNTDELASMGSSIFKVTGKPYADHPRFQALLRDARNRRIKDYNIRQGEQKIEMQEMLDAASLRAPGGVLSREELEELRREAYDKFDNGIVDGVINGYARQSAEKQLEIDADMRIQAWLNSNPGKKLPLSVVGDAPFNIRQKYASQMEADANAETTEEFIRSSEQFKALPKDLDTDLESALDLEMNSLTGITKKPRNYQAYKTQATNWIVNRARSLMLGSSSMTLDQAIGQAKQEHYDNVVKNKEKLLKNNTIQGFQNLGLSQAAGTVARQIQEATLQNFQEVLYDSDFEQPQSGGRYSERVRVLAARLGVPEKELVNIARYRKGLEALPNSPQDDILRSLSRTELRKITAINQPPIHAALRAQTISGVKVGGTAEERTVAVGQVLQAAGFYPWQHKDFKAFHGYTGSGQERVMQREYPSLHNKGGGQALDYALDNHTEQQLDQLYAFLNKNKKRFGIRLILWRTKGHYDHLHVDFE